MVARGDAHRAQEPRECGSAAECERPGAHATGARRANAWRDVRMVASGAMGGAEGAMSCIQGSASSRKRIKD